MKRTIKVVSVQEADAGKHLVIGIEGGGSLKLENKGGVKENPPTPGCEIEITLSADKFEKLDGGGSVIGGRFHGIVSPSGQAQSIDPPRRSDF